MATILRRSRLPLLAALPLLLTAHAAQAQPEPAPQPPTAESPATFVLLGVDLRTEPILVRRISAAGIEYTDNARNPRRQPPSAFLALLPPWWIPAAAAPDDPSSLTLASTDDRTSGHRARTTTESDTPRQLIELTSGERIVGLLSISPPFDPDSLRWVHPAIGTFTIPLESVLRITLAEPEAAETPDPRKKNAAPPPPPPVGQRPPTEDSVLTLTGDRISGFVESIAADVSIRRGTDLLTIPIGQAREVAMVNKRIPPPADGCRLWLHDGTVIDAAAWSTLSGGAGEPFFFTPRLPAAPSAAESTIAAPGLKLRDVTAIIQNPRSILALAALAPAGQSAAPGRLLEPLRTGREHPELGGPPLGAEDIELPSPMTVQWTLPAGAARLTGWAELPRRCWDWGDCDLVISIAAKPGVKPADAAPRTLFRERLHAQRPLIPIDLQLPADLPGGTLVVELDAGRSGGIQDTIHLRRALILTK